MSSNRARRMARERNLARRGTARQVWSLVLAPAACESTAMPLNVVIRMLRDDRVTSDQFGGVKSEWSPLAFESNFDPSCCDPRESMKEREHTRSSARANRRTNGRELKNLVGQREGRGRTKVATESRQVRDGRTTILDTKKTNRGGRDGAGAQKIMVGLERYLKLKRHTNVDFESKRRSRYVVIICKSQLVRASLPPLRKPESKLAGEKQPLINCSKSVLN